MIKNEEQMNPVDLSYSPIEGKTYSLFGNNQSTNEYYSLIRNMCDKIVQIANIQEIIETIRKYSSKKKYLKKLVTNKSNSLISICINTIHNDLKQFTKNTEAHLKALPAYKFWDRRLATTEEQYHLYMIEIELTNRLNKQKFLNADRKISLQPYCLQDFSVKCKASPVGLDYQCRHCSKKCFQSRTSHILEKNQVEPYIWMGAGIKKAAKETFKKHQTFGILGIACIPELVGGMRKCARYGIPVVGIPLNANRCMRWFGEFHQNSIDLEELEMLLNP